VLVGAKLLSLAKSFPLFQGHGAAQILQLPRRLMKILYTEPVDQVAPEDARTADLQRSLQSAEFRFNHSMSASALNSATGQHCL